MAADYMLEIDVAHPPRKPLQVETTLHELLSEVRGSRQFRALKVIHGYGSHGRGGATRETVRDWAFRHRRQFKAIIEGEDYDMYDHDTQDMRSECGHLDDVDFGAANPGITILWIK